MNRQLKIGISSYTYTWAIGVPGYCVCNPMSVFDLITQASRLGAKVVQLADNVPLEQYSKEALAELLLFAREKNIDIEVGAKGLTAGRLEKYLDIARELESEIIRFVIDNDNYKPSPDEAVAVIKPFVPLLERLGKKLVLENHDRLKCREFQYIVNACRSSCVGICLDTVNSVGVPEGLEEVVAALSPMTLNLHVKDFIIERLDHKMGFKVEGAPAGKGKLNVAELLRKVCEAGKCKTAILELWTPFGATVEETIAREAMWAEESMGYLNNLSY